MNVTITMQRPTFALANSQALFERDMLQSLHTAIDPMMADVKGATPDSIASAYKIEDVVAGGQVGIKITNDSPIRAFWEEDTKPHDIFPRSARVLAFPVAGSTVFSRSVHHPGTKGHHVFQSRRDAAAPAIAQAIQAGLYAYVLDSIGGRS